MLFPCSVCITSRTRYSSILKLNKDNFSLGLDERIYYEEKATRTREKCSRLCVPAHKAKDLVNAYHGHPTQPHLGAAYTWQAVRSRIWTPGIYNMVVEACKLCIACQLHSGTRRVTGERHATRPCRARRWADNEVFLSKSFILKPTRRELSQQTRKGKRGGSKPSPSDNRQLPVRQPIHFRSDPVTPDAQPDSVPIS